MVFLLKIQHIPIYKLFLLKILAAYAAAITWNWIVSS